MPVSPCSFNSIFSGLTITTVSVHAIPAIQVLLELGADPLSGEHSPGYVVQTASALCIAYQLHMADVIEILLCALENGRARTTTPMIQILNQVQRFKCAPRIERALVHGPYVEDAAREVFQVLRHHYLGTGSKSSTWDLMKYAAQNCDPDLCSIILGDGSELHETIGIEKHLALADLMSICVAVACSNPDFNSAIRMIEFAINIGCDINCIGTEAIGHERPLFHVIDRHQADLLDWILQNTEVDVKTTDKRGSNVLHRLIESGFSTSFNISKLINRGADPNQINHKEQRPIDLVKGETMIDEVRTLLPLSNLALKEVEAMLFHAIKGDSAKLVEAYLQGFKVDRYHEGFVASMLTQAFELAAEHASAEIAEILISSGARGTAGFYQASRSGNIDVLAVCLKHDPELFNSQTTSVALLLAVTTLCNDGADRKGARTCAHVLLEAGANPNHQDSARQTPLGLLLWTSRDVRMKNVSLIEELLRAGARIPKSNMGTSSEHLLSRILEEGNLDIAYLLLRYDNGNLQLEEHGHNYLHCCVRLACDLSINELALSRPAQIAWELLSDGANPLIRERDTWENENALTHAVLAKNGPITLIIIQYLITSGEVSRLLKRGSGNDKRVNKSRQLIRNVLKEIQPSRKVKVQPQIVTALQEGWGLAVFSESNPCICAFIRTKTYGPTHFMTRRLAISLLQYALRHEISDVLIKFLGGKTEEQKAERPDEYLGAVWDSIRCYFPPSFSDPASEPLIVSRLKDTFAADIDMPSNTATFRQHFHRLRYFNLCNGYSTAIPAEFQKAHGFLEMQNEPDFKEVRIDKIAKRKRPQFSAMHSLIFPEMMDDEDNEDDEDVDKQEQFSSTDESGGMYRRYDATNMFNEDEYLEEDD